MWVLIRFVEAVPLALLGSVKGLGTRRSAGGSTAEVCCWNEHSFPVIVQFTQYGFLSSHCANVQLEDLQPFGDADLDVTLLACVATVSALLVDTSRHGVR